MDVLPHKGEIGESKRMLFFILENKGKVQFRLEMHPGPQQIRKRVYESAKELPEIFGKPKATLSPKFHSFFSETWITQKEYDELSDDEIRQRIGEKIQSFLDRKGNAVADALKGLKFEMPEER